MGFLDKLKSGLSKTKKNLVERVETVLLNRTIDDAAIDAVEEILVTSDMGAEATAEITGALRTKVSSGEIRTSRDVNAVLRAKMVSLLGTHQPLVIFGETPFVILVVGVNGVGKTTTIGKLAARFISEGNSVLIAAGDTFRAAAIEQLEI